MLNIDLPLQLQDFVTLFLGLIVEAFPFVVLGVLISVIVALVNSEQLLVRLLPKNNILSHLVISFMGMLMPVCECGNVPVVRRLLVSGFNVSHAVTFLLAAPIVNPITLWATLEAFSFEPAVAFIRIAAAVAIAVSLGLIISRNRHQEQLLNETFYEHQVCNHEHHHHTKLGTAVDVFTSEFVTVMRMLIIGAAIAATSQVFIPRDVILTVGSDPILSIIAMLILAFVISICANVDAFFALSYAGSFSLGSIMTFLVFGPMIDIKMLTMLRTTFKANFLLFMSFFVGLASVALGLLVNLLL